MNVYLLVLTQGNVGCHIRGKALLVGTDVAQGDGVQVKFLRLAQDISGEEGSTYLITTDGYLLHNTIYTRILIHLTSYIVLLSKHFVLFNTMSASIQVSSKSKSLY